MRIDIRHTDVEPNRKALLVGRHEGVDDFTRYSCRSYLGGRVRIARIMLPEPQSSVSIAHLRASSAEKRFSRLQKVEVSFGDAVGRGQPLV